MGHVHVLLMQKIFLPVKGYQAFCDGALEEVDTSAVWVKAAMMKNMETTF